MDSSTQLEATAAERSREQLPLRGYATLSAVYGTSTAALFAWAAVQNRLPSRVPWSDVAMMGLAAHRASRTLSRDKIFTYARRPLTVLQDTDGPPAEVHEQQRTDGGELRRAAADLLTCPYCLTPWVATGLFGAYLANRKLGRAISGLLAVVAVADFAHSAWVDATT